MTFQQVQFIFNRALALTFNKKKLLFIFIVMALCGLLVVFCRGLAGNANQWMAQSLTFLPVFLCSGVMLASGIILIRMYHDEIKQRKVSFREIWAKSWETVIGASYFAIPMMLVYLLLWMMLGLFLLLGKTPMFGDFFSVILSFAPFLINLCTLILCIVTFAVLFFVSPVVALKGLNKTLVAQVTAKKFKTDPFSNLFLALVAVMPIACSLGLLSLSAFLTGTIFQGDGGYHLHSAAMVLYYDPFYRPSIPRGRFLFQLRRRSPRARLQENRVKYIIFQEIASLGQVTG